jgi:hypothetical protein
MPNKNYLAGRRWEYDVMKYLRDADYKVIRASGSHGEFDIVAYKPQSTLFIQCKRVDTLAEARRMGVNWKKSPPNPPAQVSFTQQLWVKVKGEPGNHIFSA